MAGAVLFDMDGVLAAVGSSYRAAILQTVAHFGGTITSEDITAEKKRGNANNDWILSQKLIASSTGVIVPLDEVTEVFEELYQGVSGRPGLCESETLIPSRGLIQEVHRRCKGKIAVVTGRPRKDCIKFLSQHNLLDLFPVCVCMEDVPAKPAPDGCRMACLALHVDPTHAVIVGDTPDDIRSCVAAGGKGYGVLTPDEEAKLLLGLITPDDAMTSSLLAAGAERILRAGLSELLDLLPAETALEHPRRAAIVERQTQETHIKGSVELDGTGVADVSTGVGFLDHMVGQLAKHGRFDIVLKCKGDLHIDDHHTIEDCALVLGEAFDQALGKRKGIVRFADAHCPLDDALSRVVVDISSRPFASVDLGLKRESVGKMSAEMLVHFLQSFAQTARLTLHVHVLSGHNDHHKAESAFKALAVALRKAVTLDPSAGVPSTKGVLA